MITLRNARARLGRSRLRRSDRGISIVEALIAAVVFMLISVGVAQAMVNAIRLSGDGQHRSVALNLAAAELDRLKALNNPYAVSSTTTPVTTTIDGITYSLRRTASWVNVSGNEISCAVASGNFQLLRVRVSVDWGGRMPGSSVASSATTLSPQNTILSPTTATLFIAVTKSDGTPYVGITPKVVAPGGSVMTVPATNSDGCSYLSGIGAGNYTVSVTATNGISGDQTAVAAAKPTPTVVTPGSAVSVPFSYDQQSTLSLTYGAAGTIAPTDLVTSFSSSTASAPYTVTGTQATVNLFPVSSGYSVSAGKLLPAVTGANSYTGCLSPDSANWTAGQVKGVRLSAGSDPANATAAPGSASSYSVPMGTASVTTLTGGYVRVTSAPATVQGDPGCADLSTGPAQTYTYRIPNGGTWNLAMPFGSWNSTFAGSLLGVYLPINATPTTNAWSSSASSNFTMDPRTP